MKTYINNNFFMALIALGMMINFASCSDDNFVNEITEVETINPDTLPYIFVTGIITDSDGNKLSNVTVDYLVDGEETNVTSNAEGVYEIRNLDSYNDRTVIRCHREGFLPKVDVLLSNDEKVINRNIVLAKKDEINGGSSGELSSVVLTDSLISVMGRLINEDGDGIAGIPVLVINIDFSSFVYDITDEDGNWSLALEPLEGAVVVTFNQCEGTEIITGELSLLEDTDLGDLNTTQIQPTFVNFTGFVTDCNTESGLLSGSIQFSFPDNPDKYTANIINGQYLIELPQCASAECIDVTIFSFVPSNGQDDFDCQQFTSGANTLNYEVCNSANPTDNGGYLTTNINGELTEYFLVGVEEQETQYFISTLNSSLDSGVLLITETKEDAGFIDIFAVVPISSQQPVYVGGDQTVSYQIDSTTTEYLYGSYQGTILDLANNNAELSVEGVFKAKFQ